MRVAPGVHGVDASLAVEHDHASGQVVEDGLQIGTCPFDLRHTALHQRACLGELFGHVGERARQPAQLITRVEHLLGPQVALRNLPHTVGQHQQRLGDLIRQRQGQQQRTEHRKNQCQRQRADVHLAQTLAGQ